MTAQVHKKWILEDFESIINHFSILHMKRLNMVERQIKFKFYAPLLYPWKHQKTVRFSKGGEMVHWEQMS